MLHPENLPIQNSSAEAVSANSCSLAASISPNANQNDTNVPPTVRTAGHSDFSFAPQMPKYPSAATTLPADNSAAPSAGDAGSGNANSAVSNMPFILNPNREIELRDGSVVFVNHKPPGKEPYEYFWIPAMIVPPTEFDYVTIGRPLKVNQRLVRFFADNRDSIVTNKDIMPFDPLGAKFKEFQNQFPDFLSDQGVRNAIVYHSTGAINDKFKWKKWGSSMLYRPSDRPVTTTRPLSRPVPAPQAIAPSTTAYIQTNMTSSPSRQTLNNQGSGFPNSQSTPNSRMRNYSDYPPTDPPQSGYSYHEHEMQPQPLHNVHESSQYRMSAPPQMQAPHPPSQLPSAPQLHHQPPPTHPMHHHAHTKSIHTSSHQKYAPLFHNEGQGYLPPQQRMERITTQQPMERMPNEEWVEPLNQNWHGYQPKMEIVTLNNNSNYYSNTETYSNHESSMHMYTPDHRDRWEATPDSVRMPQIKTEPYPNYGLGAVTSPLDLTKIPTRSTLISQPITFTGNSVSFDLTRTPSKTFGHSSARFIGEQSSARHSPPLTGTNTPSRSLAANQVITPTNYPYFESSYMPEMYQDQYFETYHQTRSPSHSQWEERSEGFPNDNLSYTGSSPSRNENFYSSPFISPIAPPFVPDNRPIELPPSAPVNPRDDVILQENAAKHAEMRDGLENYNTHIIPSEVGQNFANAQTYSLQKSNNINRAEPSVGPYEGAENNPGSFKDPNDVVTPLNPNLSNVESFQEQSTSIPESQHFPKYIPIVSVNTTENNADSVDSFAPLPVKRQLSHSSGSPTKRIKSSNGKSSPSPAPESDGVKPTRKRRVIRKADSATISEPPAALPRKTRQSRKTCTPDMPKRSYQSNSESSSPPPLQRRSRARSPNTYQSVKSISRLEVQRAPQTLNFEPNPLFNYEAGTLNPAEERVKYLARMKERAKGMQKHYLSMKELMNALARGQQISSPEMTKVKRMVEMSVTMRQNNAIEFGMYEVTGDA